MTTIKALSLTSIPLSLMILVVGMLSVTLQVNAEIYKTTDEHGKTIFTDQPEPGYETVEVNEPNTVKHVTPSYRPTTLKPQTPDAVYQSLKIISPGNGSHLQNGLVAFNVTMSLTPQLRNGHKIQVIINGAVHSTGSSLSRQVASIARGEHNLSAKVIDQKGKTLITSPSSIITAQRPSRLNRAN
jgi:hypothetical protein